MNKKTLLLFFFALMISPFAALAQTIAVSGKVISSDDGYGLPGVTIQVKGTSTGTVTDIDGNYTLKANSQDVLIFSFVGYKTKEIAIKGKTTINVTLDTDAQLLDDVVVTALGIKRRRGRHPRNRQVARPVKWRLGRMSNRRRIHFEATKHPEGKSNAHAFIAKLPPYCNQRRK